MMKSRDVKKVDIVIAGAGPVGLAAACSLSGTGLQILLIDAGKEAFTLDEIRKNADQAEFDPRVSALTVSSQIMLEQLGVWELMQSVRVCPYHSMDVWDGEGTGSIHFAAAELHAESLGHIVENRLINAALFERVKSSPQITTLHNTEIEAINTGENPDSSLVIVTLANGDKVAASLLIGADGGNSFIREQSGFTVRQWEYGHKALVTTVKTELGHQFSARQRFMKTGPLAFLPLFLATADKSEQQYCSIVWSCVTEEADALIALDDNEFMQRLGEAFEFRLGKILEIDDRASFPLWQRHATDYVQDNIALIGDAAHSIHPLAGQGVNMGFADVEALSQVISSALVKGEDIACHQTLSRYQRARKGQNMTMMAAMEGFKRLFGSEDPGLKWLRNSGLKLTDKLPGVKKQLMRQAMGL
jgi:2-octaprenylphenol hydroxylase